MKHGSLQGRLVVLRLAAKRSNLKKIRVPFSQLSAAVHGACLPTCIRHHVAQIRGAESNVDHQSNLCHCLHEALYGLKEIHTYLHIYVYIHILHTYACIYSSISLYM